MGGERSGGKESFDDADSEQTERTSGQHHVQDQVEAEHMAHAMDPHYARASHIDEIARQGQDVTEKQKELDGKDMIPDEIYERGDAAVRTQAEDEAESWAHRTVYVADERDALDEAASAARKAGDSAGGLASRVYRRKRSDDPPA